MGVYISECKDNIEWYRRPNEWEMLVEMAITIVFAHQLHTTHLPTRPLPRAVVMSVLRDIIMYNYKYLSFHFSKYLFLLHWEM